MFGIAERTVYLGNSLELFNKVRNLLEDNKIKYKYDIKNHQTALMSPGRGTARTVVGSFGKLSEYDSLYEIKVNEKLFDKANYLIKTEGL